MLPKRTVVYTEHNQRQKLIEYGNKHMPTQQIDCLATCWTLKTASLKSTGKIYIGFISVPVTLGSYSPTVTDHI